MFAKNDIQSITQWIDGQTIFITGASGFLGKVLVYKLLKSCTTISAIYLLLRPKKGKTPEERLEQLFSSSMFDKMKKDDPEIFKKVKMIEGDMTEKNLGIKKSDWEMLQNNVTIIINAAASVRFDDTLKKAIFTNTRSAKYALLLAKGMKHLKVFVHVSTLYSNCNHLHIPEKIIPSDYDPEKMIKIAENLDEYEFEVFTQKILESFPNTYVFTKYLAEHLVYKERHEIPSIIYRPGIILGSTKEPEPGWCDTFNSLSAFAAAGGKGIVRVSYGKDFGTFLIINADACVNGLIVASWYRDQHLPIKRGPTDNKIIINAADYQFGVNFFVRWLRSIEYSTPVSGQLWKASCSVIKSRLMFQILTILQHLSLGLLVDTFLVATGKKPRLIKMYRKIYTAALNLHYFMSHRWTIENDNFKNLGMITSQEEKKVFFTDSLFETPFDQMMLNAVYGVRKLLGDSPRPTKEDLEHTKMLYYIDLGVKLAFFGIFIWLLPLKDLFEWSASKFTEFDTAWDQFTQIVY